MTGDARNSEFCLPSLNTHCFVWGRSGTMITCLACPVLACVKKMFNDSSDPVSRLEKDLPICGSRFKKE